MKIPQEGLASWSRSMDCAILDRLKLPFFCFCGWCHGYNEGLEHSSKGSAILAPSVSPSEYFTALDQDDVDAILSSCAPANGLNPLTTPSSANKPTATNTPFVTCKPLVTNTLPPTQSFPTTKPMDSATDWSILDNRAHRFWRAYGLTEFNRNRRFFG